MRLLDNLIWAKERHVNVKSKEKTRKSTEEIIAKRNKIYEHMLNVDLKDGNIKELKAWIDALDWSMGVNNGKS